MSIRIVRLGTPRAPTEGIRFGTVRRPPRGVRKTELASRDYYDVWLPALSPSAALVKLALAAVTDAEWAKVVRKYRTEMKGPTAAPVLSVLAALSHEASFSVGCYCEDESRCHRSILRELLREHGAKLG
jgi:uncharacterized protein YeaO (DUF488 family)